MLLEQPIISFGTRIVSDVMFFKETTFSPSLTTSPQTPILMPPPTERFEKAHIERKDMMYLYEDSGLYYFMDNNTYEQIPLNKSQVEDALNYITENMSCTIQFYKGEAFSVEPPLFVELKIVECEPGLQGDTSKAGYKPATLETGLVLQVPLFVNNGETIRVDTRTGSYMERV